MTSLIIKRPEATEYAPYYGRYISLVPEADVLTLLGEQVKDTLKLLEGVPESEGGFRYAAGKWSIKELVGHMTDTERIFSYRALRFARADETALSGFEQDDYIRSASFNDYALAELVSEFECVRRSTLFLFKHLSAAAWDRRGTASESEVSVRALAYIIAGHELHHREVLRTRYLQTGAANP